MSPAGESVSDVGQGPLAANVRALGIVLSAEALALFAVYQRELLDWNRRVNLTAIRDPAEVQVKHFADSLAVLRSLPTAGLSVLDVGSGAGFPGVPIRIARPDVELTLLESVGKKTAFLSHLTAALGLESVRVVTARAEDFAREFGERERYDVVVSRAVASLPALAELCLPLARVGGLVIAQKNAAIYDELRSASRALGILGGALRPVVRYRLPDFPDERWLVIVEKVRETPSAYPRRAGLPAKSPL